MATTTTNFGWDIPQSTDLVKDGATAIATLGQDIDTSMVDLKGGTTGQVLKKASNTDMDFTWSSETGDIEGVSVTSPLTGGGTSGTVTVGIQDGTTTQKGAVQLTDSTSSTSTTTAATPNSVKSAYDLGAAAIPKSTVTTNGDLIYGTGSSTVTRLGIGSSGQVLSVSSGVPAWTTISAGSLTQLATGTLSGTQVQLSSISGSYKNLHLVLRDLTFSSSAAKPQVKFNNTSTEAAVTLFRSGTTTPYQTNSGIFYLGATSTQSMTNTSAENNFAITIYDYAQTAAYKSLSYCGVYRNENDGTYNGVMGGGGVRLTAAISSLEITMDGTITFSGGTYILYGVN